MARYPDLASALQPLQDLPLPEGERGSPGRGRKRSTGSHPCPSQPGRNPSPVRTQAASAAFSHGAYGAQLLVPPEPVCRSLLGSGSPRGHPAAQTHCVPPERAARSDPPDISSGQRHPGCCGQLRFRALAWCPGSWLVLYRQLEQPGQGESSSLARGSTGGSRCHAAAAAQVIHRGAGAGGSPGERSEGEEADQYPIPPRSLGETGRAPISQVETHAAASRAAKDAQAAATQAQPRWDGTKGPPDPPSSRPAWCCGLSPATSRSRKPASPGGSPSSHCHPPAPSTGRRHPEENSPCQEQRAGEPGRRRAGEPGAGFAGRSLAGQRGNQQERWGRVAGAAAGPGAARSAGGGKQRQRPRQKGRQRVERSGAAGRTGHPPLLTGKRHFHQPCCLLPGPARAARLCQPSWGRGPSLPRGNWQRLARGRGAELVPGTTNGPSARERKSLLRGQVHHLSERLCWAGKWKSEAVTATLPAAPSSLRRIG